MSWYIVVGIYQSILAVSYPGQFTLIQKTFILATILYSVTKTDLSAPSSVIDCQCPRGKPYAFTTLATTEGQPGSYT